MPTQNEMMEDGNWLQACLHWDPVGTLDELARVGCALTATLWDHPQNVTRLSRYRHFLVRDGDLFFVVGMYSRPPRMFADAQATPPPAVGIEPVDFNPVECRRPEPCDSGNDCECDEDWDDDQEMCAACSCGCDLHSYGEDYCLAHGAHHNIQNNLRRNGRLS